MSIQPDDVFSYVFMKDARRFDTCCMCSAVVPYDKRQHHMQHHDSQERVARVALDGRTIASLPLPVPTSVTEDINRRYRTELINDTANVARVEQIHLLAERIALVHDVPAGSEIRELCNRILQSMRKR